MVTCKFFSSIEDIDIEIFAYCTIICANSLDPDQAGLIIIIGCLINPEISCLICYY